MLDLEKLSVVRAAVASRVSVLFGKKLDFTLIVWPTEGGALIDGTVCSPRDVIARLEPHG